MKPATSQAPGLSRLRTCCFFWGFRFTKAAIQSVGQSERPTQHAWASTECPNVDLNDCCNALNSHPPTNPQEPLDLCFRARNFLDQWNANVASRFNPAWILVVDESMACWKGVGGGMPSLMFVAHKPTPSGREMHTTACVETRIICFAERYEGN